MKRLCQGYPVNWWPWLNLSSGLLKSYACSTTSGFKYVVQRQPASKLLAHFLNGQVFGRRSGDSYLIQLPGYPYAKVQDLLLSTCVDPWMSCWSWYSHHPRGGLGSTRATHEPLSRLRECLLTARQPCLSQQNVSVPTHSGHHRVDVKKPELLQEQFVVILSLPIIFLNKTDLPSDIQTGWFMQSG